MKYKVYRTETVCFEHEVEANSEEEAIEKAEEIRVNDDTGNDGFVSVDNVDYHVEEAP